jgi:SAM-dependent methyltransferase
VVREVERAAKWRGNPNASDKGEFFRLLKFLRPSKKDVFYDLGCGHGRPCIWIAPKVKLAVGVEDHYQRYLRAKKNAKESKSSKRIKILWKDIENISYKEATLLYSVIYVGFGVMEKIQREAKPGTKVVLYGVPPYPLKSRKLFGNYHLFKTPFERVRSDDEFARIYLGHRKATMKELLKSLDREEARDLRREITEANANWNGS